MKKFKVFWNMEAEEVWLNEMALQGHILKKYSQFGRYHFADGEPQRLNYKVDYRTFNTHRDFADYVALFDDAGWRLVYGSPYGGSQYFLPKDPAASREIFSDPASAAGRYKVQYTLCIANALVAAALIAAIWAINGFDLSAFGFLTPGLWQKTGPAFWRAFWIELPAVALRVAGPLLLLASSAVYGYWGTRARAEYKRGLARGRGR